MNRKSIILPAIAGLVILISAGALTFASSAQSLSGVNQGHMRMGGGFRGMGLGISGGAQGMKNLSETDRKAMIDAVKKAIDAKDYTLFKAVHAQYGITLNMTEVQFTTMIKNGAAMDQRRAEKDALKTKIQEALKNGDFITRKSLNKDLPILKYIDTQEKFIKLQEMDTYRTKIGSISKELGLPQGHQGKRLGGNDRDGMMGK